LTAAALSLWLVFTPVPDYYGVPGVAISYQPIIDHWADVYLVPRFLARKVAAAESGNNPKAQSYKVVLNTRWYANSPDYDPLALYRKIVIAQGLFQLHKAWQRELVWFARSTDPGRPFQWWDASDSARVGLNYLARLHKKYGRWGYAVAASNCGPGKFDRWLKNGGRLPKETINHVRKVMK